MLLECLADIRQYLHDAISGARTFRVGKSGNLGQDPVEHGVKKAFLAGEMAVDRCVIDSELLADGSKSELGHAVFLNEIDGHPHELLSGKGSLRRSHGIEASADVKSGSM